MAEQSMIETIARAISSVAFAELDKVGGDFERLLPNWRTAVRYARRNARTALTAQVQAGLTERMLAHSLTPMPGDEPASRAWQQQNFELMIRAELEADPVR